MSVIRKSAIDKIKKLNKSMSQIKKRTYKPPAILSYGVAVLSVIAAVIILLRTTPRLLDNAPHVSAFLCAIIFSTWFGGTRSGLFAVVLSALAFDYYFLPPFYSFTPEITQVPRIL